MLARLKEQPLVYNLHLDYSENSYIHSLTQYSIFLMIFQGLAAHPVSRFRILAELYRAPKCDPRFISPEQQTLIFVYVEFRLPRFAKDQRTRTISGSKVTPGPGDYFRQKLNLDNIREPPRKPVFSSSNRTNFGQSSSPGPGAYEVKVFSIGKRGVISLLSNVAPRLQRDFEISRVI